MFGILRKLFVKASGSASLEKMSAKSISSKTLSKDGDGEYN